MVRADAMSVVREAWNHLHFSTRQVFSGSVENEEKMTEQLFLQKHVNQ